MEFTILKHDLVGMLSTVAPAAMRGTGTPIPIMTAVLLRASEGQVTARCFNLEQCIETVCDAVSVHRAGSAAIDVAKILRMVQSLPDGDVTIATTDTRATISSAAGPTYRMPIWDDADFPAAPATGPGAEMTVDAQIFASAIRDTLAAAGDGDPRAYLNTILFTGGQLVATDGHKLLVRTGWAGAAPSGDLPAVMTPGMGATLLPVSAARTLIGLLDRVNGDISLVVGVLCAWTSVTAGPTTAMFRMTDNTYPDYHQVVPKPDDSCAVMVSADALIDALRRVKGAATGKDFPAAIVRADGEIMTIDALRHGDGIEYHEAIPCAATKRMVCGLGVGTALPMLDVYAGRDIVLQIIAADKPVTITADGCPSFGVVMPVCAEEILGMERPVKEIEK
jgi:DNA polymerase III sliding clamp (beta) subunit (PCNA family)